METSANEAKSAASWDRALLDSLFGEPVGDPLRLLILRDMALIADDTGGAPIAILAQRFRNFFHKRCQEGKREERADVLASAFASNEPLSGKPLDWWQRFIAERARANASDLVVHDGERLAFRSELWARWTPGFRKALRNIAEARLIEYFDTRVEGGW